MKLYAPTYHSAVHLLPLYAVLHHAFEESSLPTGALFFAFDPPEAALRRVDTAAEDLRRLELAAFLRTGAFFGAAARPLVAALSTWAVPPSGSDCLPCTT